MLSVETTLSVMRTTVAKVMTAMSFEAKVALPAVPTEVAFPVVPAKVFPVLLVSISTSSIEGMYRGFHLFLSNVFVNLHLLGMLLN